MPLSTYKAKRNLSKTPEPSGGQSKEKGLSFVVQKHDASHLHYDFRLEMDGVLKSWAVPKGPSTDPSIKRLAMMVEDHPYDYKDFEGVIPKGNYGAGTVEIWDNGTYEPITGVTGKAAMEKELLRELKAGNLKFVLHGKKLKGEFALVHTHMEGGKENAWLLIKHKEPDAPPAQPVSQPAKAQPASTPRRAAAKVEPHAAAKPAAPVPRSAKASVPKTITPMLATLVDEPFDAEGWLYEIKWDGYRAIALLHKGKVELISRNQQNYNKKYEPIYDALKAWGRDAIVDGEIVVVDDKGVSHFGALQNWQKTKGGTLIYYVFDLLWLDGRDLKNEPLSERRALLKEILPQKDPIRLSENFDTSATEFLKKASQLGLEGIIAKRADSLYREGDRSRDWLKMKVDKRHEVVIGGYTHKTGSPKAFSALLAGVFENGKLRYLGKIGTGFSDAQQKEMIARFKPFITDKSPFLQQPRERATVTWLKPKLVGEVHYTEMTEDGLMRHPAFVGMREDKDAKEVAPEKAVKIKSVIVKDRKPEPRRVTKETEETKPATKRLASSTKPPAAAKRPTKPAPSGTLLAPGEDTQTINVSGHALTFTHLDKVFWPDEGYTKRDLLNYYHEAAEYILPYLKNRPQSLNRFPNGIKGQGFYQKDVTNTAPDWVKEFPYETDGEAKNFLVVENEASILWMVNLGVIEMNPWNSTIKKPDHPDWCIIDLDPSEKNTFEQVIQAAQATKDVLDGLKITGYPKTSGSTGIHIYIPLGAKYTYEQSQLLAKWIVTSVNETLKDFTTIERMTNKRNGKMYLDFLQNRPQATLAAPYAVRPKPGATVSMPLHWEEVKKGLKVKDFTIQNVLDRIRREGDIFRPVLDKGIDLNKILKSIPS